MSTVTNLARLTCISAGKCTNHSDHSSERLTKCASYITELQQKTALDETVRSDVFFGYNKTEVIYKQR